MTDETKKMAGAAEPEETGRHETESEEQRSATLEAQLVAKEEEVQSCIDRLKRLQAEFENYRKRMQREIGTFEKRISDREILDFLPLYDNMERAFTSFSGNHDATLFVEGIKRIFAQFGQILKQKGVCPIEALGTRFDPAQHEALLSVESDGEENMILEELERGYKRDGRLLRPSKVKVSRGRLQTEEETS